MKKKRSFVGWIQDNWINLGMFIVMLLTLIGVSNQQVEIRQEWDKVQAELGLFDLIEVQDKLKSQKGEFKELEVQDKLKAAFINDIGFWNEIVGDTLNDYRDYNCIGAECESLPTYCLVTNETKWCVDYNYGMNANVIRTNETDEPIQFVQKIKSNNTIESTGLNVTGDANIINITIGGKFLISNIGNELFFYDYLGNKIAKLSESGDLNVKGRIQEDWNED